MKLIRHKKFINDLKKVRLSDSQYEKLIRYLGMLLQQQTLPAEARDHSLKGEYSDTNEFHLGGDMLVVYMHQEEQIVLLRIGTHAQLFK